jgi:hypothetical protein
MAESRGFWAASSARTNRSALVVTITTRASPAASDTIVVTTPG